MTGEITLSGRVLPVGGIKEKVLAAHRAGITTIILPRQNEKALVEDVPADVRAQLTVHLVSTVGEVLRLALPDDQPPRRESGREAALAGAAG
jgi:ATP-dependent Lon protease